MHMLVSGFYSILLMTVFWDYMRCLIACTFLQIRCFAKNARLLPYWEVSYNGTVYNDQYSLALLRFCPLYTSYWMIGRMWFKVTFFENSVEIGIVEISSIYEVWVCLYTFMTQWSIYNLFLLWWFSV